MSLQVYQYDLSGLFVSVVEADESPLEPGVFLMPAMTTEVAPPTGLEEGNWPRWNGAAWDVIPYVVKQPDPDLQDPLSKLKNFLAENPDVAAILK